MYGVTVHVKAFFAKEGRVKMVVCPEPLGFFNKLQYRWRVGPCSMVVRRASVPDSSETPSSALPVCRAAFSG